MSVMRSRKFDNTNNLRLEIERADSVSTVETVTASLKQLVDVDVDVIDEDTLHVEIGICDNYFHPHIQCWWNDLCRLCRSC